MTRNITDELAAHIIRELGVPDDGWQLDLFREAFSVPSGDGTAIMETVPTDTSVVVFVGPHQAAARIYEKARELLDG